MQQTYTITQAESVLSLSKRHVQRLCQNYQSRFNLHKHGTVWVVTQEFIDFLKGRQGVKNGEKATKSLSASQLVNG